MTYNFSDCFKLKDNYLETHPGLTPTRHGWIKIVRLEETIYGKAYKFLVLTKDGFVEPPYPYTHLSEASILEDYEGPFIKAKILGDKND